MKVTAAYSGRECSVCDGVIQVGEWIKPSGNDRVWRHGDCTETPTEPHHDPVNNPAHYTTHPSGVEPIVIAETMGFCLGNVIKYVMRADLKGDAIEDLQKAEFYIKREIARREKEVKEG